MMGFDDAGNIRWVCHVVSGRSWIIYGDFSILGLFDGIFVVPG
jgi:hypothetical protein